MTEQEVKSRVEHIVDLCEDFESAHGAEKTLWKDVLKSIATGTCENSKRCAMLALKTEQIKFQRVYA